MGRRLRERLERHAYKAIARDAVNKPPFLAVFEKRVATLSDARRERARLDRALFGD